VGLVVVTGHSVLNLVSMHLHPDPACGEPSFPREVLCHWWCATALWGIHHA